MVVIHGAWREAPGVTDLCVSLAADLDDVLLPDLLPIREERDHTIWRYTESSSASEIEIEQAIQAELSE